MSAAEKAWVIHLLVASVILVAVPVINVVGRFFWYKRHRYARTQRKYPGLLFWTGFTLLSVWMLRFAVALYFPHCGTNDIIALTPLEEFFNSMVHALQTLSMDEDYTLYIQQGRAMMDALVGEKTFLTDLYGFYASVLNAAAPVLGGAALFEILANVFPSIRLRFSHGTCWRETCYFSELNEASLALAKSLLLDKYRQFCRPAVVFTDAYTDREKEKDNELLAEAKSLGAICVRDDVIHVAKKWWGPRTFFLMDMKEDGNLHTLTELTAPENARKLKKAKVYLFVNSDAYVRLEQQVRQHLLDNVFDGREEDLPTIIPVQSERNLVSNLFADVPLYEPLVGVSSDKTVNVTVLGGGSIGMQALLTAYWMGQLPDHSLNVRVIAKETEEDFYAKLDYINPEIRQTATKKHMLLWNGEAFNDPYCELCYTQADVKQGPIWDTEAKGKNGELAKRLLETNYFVVALGSDADNIEVANRLRVFLGRHRIRTEDPTRTVIAYAVYDSTLAQALNGQQRYRSRGAEADGACDIYMVAFGSLQQVYSVNNIRMSTYSLQAEETGRHYRAEKEAEMHRIDNRRRRGSTFDNYSYWSNLARTMHIKYKVFALGGITDSVFTCSDDARRGDAVKQACRHYKWLAVTEVTKDDEADTAEEKTAIRRQLTGIPKTFIERFEAERDCIAWLEHRRWNAFLRSCGFRTAATCKKRNKTLCVTVASYYQATKSHKNLLFKLHPMLVECPKMSGKPDFLDLVTDEITRVRGEQQEDVKKYDVYAFDFAKHYPLATACRVFRLSEQEVRDAQEKFSSDPLSSDSRGPLVISESSLVMHLREKSYKTLEEWLQNMNPTGQQAKDAAAFAKNAMDAKEAKIFKLCGEYYLTAAQWKEIKTKIADQSHDER